MARRKRNYTVRTGDTAATIAQQLGIDPQTLMRANTGVSNLRPGMVIRQPPTPPQPLPMSGGGLRWTPYAFNAVNAAAKRFVPWAQNFFSSEYTEPEVGVSSPALPPYSWNQPAQPATNLRYEASPAFASASDWLTQPLFQERDYPDRQAYQTPKGSYVDSYGRRVSGDIDPRDSMSGLWGRGKPKPVVDPRKYEYGRWRSAVGETGIKPGLLPAQATTTPPGGGVGGGFTRDQSGRIVLSKDQFDLVHDYAGGNEAVKELAAAARYSPGGIIRVAGEGGSLDAIDGAYNMKVRTGPTGNITYTPVSGTGRSKGRLGYQPRWQNVGSPYKGYKSPERRREKGKEEKDTSSSAVGGAPRYQAGYNFDYDTRGGYMPMVRQRPRPNYLGLINWRI